MEAREVVVCGASAIAFACVAVAIATMLSSHRETDPLLIAALVGAYALVSRVRFEFGDLYLVPEQLLFVPMLALAPLPLVPALVAMAAVLSVVPDVLKGSWHWDRTVTAVGDCWFSVGPVLVLAAIAPGLPTLQGAGAYALAFGAQLACDGGWDFVRDRLLARVPLRELAHNYLGTARVDAILGPIAFLVAVAAVEEPLSLLAIGPLVWLLEFFSRDRRERYAATLELHRAYRGTVMLLADVVEFDDQYTAEHSRSVVDLVHGVAEELRIDSNSRQELEFAALLHDVGKIAIPKQILNKPAKLTAEEFDLMKTHTIEGQFMLDRIGGLLGRVGEIVRSCHERWDGKGYPDGLAGEKIPLASRIVFACDAYNAMTTDRPYRQALSQQEALEELRRNAGSQFDPRVVSAFTKVVEEGKPELASTDHVRALLAGSRRAIPQRATAG